MPKIEFQNFFYFPSLLCSDSEHIAYSRLSSADKNRIVPVFELSRRRSDPDLKASAQTIKKTTKERPFILSLDKRPAPNPYRAKNPKDPVAEAKRIAEETAAQKSYNVALNKLLNPFGGFAAWRQVVSAFPNTVPMLQHNDAKQEEDDILLQAAYFMETGSTLAIKVSPDGAADACSVVSKIISQLGNPEKLLIIFDCGQGRAKINEKIEFVKGGILSVQKGIGRSDRLNVQAVCMSNSYPNLGHDGYKTFKNLDWKVWQEVSKVYPFSFADYAAVFRSAKHSSFIPRTWRPTVVYSTNDEWLVYRGPNANDEQGWIQGSKEIGGDPKFDQTDKCWGTDLIKTAAGGVIDGVDSARFWHAQKTNCHIHRHIELSETRVKN